MSGFALLLSRDEQDDPGPVFTQFANDLRRFRVRGETRTEHVLHEPRLSVLKIDDPHPRHPGLAARSVSGSWMFICGSAFDLDRPDGRPDFSDRLERAIQGGSAWVAGLEGHFIAVVWDATHRLVHAATDAFGFQAAYLAEKSGHFLISTSALAVARAVQAAADPFNVRALLAIGALPGSWTLWSGVRRIEPARIWSFDGKSCRETTYFRADVDPAIARLGFEEAIETAVDHLVRTAGTAFRTEAPLWSDLSGGFDSRTLCVSLARAGVPFRANVTGPLGTPDHEYSREVATRLGVPHEPYTLPQEWPSLMRGYFEEAADRIDGWRSAFDVMTLLINLRHLGRKHPLLLGGGGAEHFRNLWWQQEFLRAGRSTHVNYRNLVEMRVLGETSLDVLRADPLDEVRIAVQDYFRQEVESGRESLNNTTKLDYLGSFKVASVFGTAISTAQGVQRVVLPHYFQRTFVLMTSLPYRYRNHHRFHRALLERLHPEAAAVQTTSGGPAAPVRLRTLTQFVPYVESVARRASNKLSLRYLGRPIWRNRPIPTYPLRTWYAALAREFYAEGILDPARMVTAPLYDPEKLRQFVEAAMSSNFSRDALLGRMVTCEVTLRRTGSVLAR